MRRDAALLLVAVAAAAGCGASAQPAANCGRDYEIYGLAATERDVQAETGASSVTCRCLDPEAAWEYECESRFADGRTGGGYVEVTDDGVRGIFGDLDDPPPLPLAEPPRLLSVAVEPGRAPPGGEVRVEVELKPGSAVGPWTLHALFFDPVPSEGSEAAELGWAGGRRYTGTLRLPPDAEPGRWRLGEITAQAGEHFHSWSEFQHDGAWHDGVIVSP